jgi:hypothetical protein
MERVELVCHRGRLVGFLGAPALAIGKFVQSLYIIASLGKSDRRKAAWENMLGNAMTGPI